MMDPEVYIGGWEDKTPSYVLDTQAPIILGFVYHVGLIEYPMIKHDQLPDEEIVKLIRLSNQELYSVLVRRYQDKLLRYVTSIVRDEHKATDVVQEVFIKAFVNLRGFNLERKFSSWIYRIAHNEALNNLKKNPQEVALLEDVDFPSEEDIAGALEREELTKEVKKCLGGLPLIYSEPLILHFDEGLSYKEMVDVLHIPMGTVATRINRGKALMKKLCLKN